MTLNKITDTDLFIGLNRTLVILDVINEVKQTTQDNEKLALYTAQRLLELLENRIMTDAEREYLETVKRNREQQQRDLEKLEQYYSKRVAQVIYHNVIITYRNAGGRKYISFDEAVDFIGQIAYRNIIYRATRGTENKYSELIKNLRGVQHETN